ncbi:MAG: ergothioneine biosynthesis protein EgtC [Phormidesmis priestleyi Ana]|uniref:Ergothioneine biosynthesis protein EgtC n=1 Tax=Phormidesmis priestleyi Ana TaxID=1666911 RepID=A0A0P7ZM31_9CYAN|nr:MAG: ergothioneine biosynthesis protein EgtC [Phormidesmis priestleyi Ana]
MCRILGYLGPPISPDQLVLNPEHSLLVQSYQPKEMKSAILNGDGFGFGWYAPDLAEKPFIYRNPLPMWNDQNLPDLCRYVQTTSFLANVRSATTQMPVELGNCQPFAYQQMMFVHNGLIENFYDTLYRPIREQLCDVAYRSIKGQTDSEHIFALLVHYLETHPGIDLADALSKTTAHLAAMAQKAEVHIAMNIILSTGDRLVAVRFDNQKKAPSLYLLNSPSQFPRHYHSQFPHHFPKSVIFASEPLFQGDWQPYPEGEVISIGSDLKITTHSTGHSIGHSIGHSTVT